jgi:hypothetical protein
MTRSIDFVMQDVGGEKLLVPLGAQVLDMNGLITLNPTAAYVWELLHEECTEEELAAAVAEQFDVAPEQAYADVHIFVNKIWKMGLLKT